GPLGAGGRGGAARCRWAARHVTWTAQLGGCEPLDGNRSAQVDGRGVDARGQPASTCRAAARPAAMQAGMPTPSYVAPATASRGCSATDSRTADTRYRCPTAY